MAADDELEKRLPPNDREAERAVLGAMLRDNRLIADVVRTIRAEHFYSFAHVAIYEAMVKLFVVGKPVDAVTLSDAIKAADRTADIGGPAYIVDLWESAPCAGNAIHYAEIVREKAQLRQIIHAGQEMVSRAFDHGADVGELLSEAEQRLFGITHDRNAGRVLTVQQILSDAADRIEQRGRLGKAVTGIPTGWNDLDVKTSGFQPGELVIVGARPSVGKTAFLVGCFAHLSGVGIPSLVFSIEQGGAELGERLISADASVNSHLIRTGKFNDADIARMVESNHSRWNAPGLVLDTTEVTTLDIMAETRRCKSRHGIQAVFVDYLQLIKAEDRRVMRHEQIASMTRRLKLMARELNIPVVVLAQLNRDIEHGAGRKPRLSDLKESGSIEQDADTVLFIHKPADVTKLREIIIAKQRNGPTGEVLLTFRAEFMRFENHSPEGPPEWTNR